MAAVLELSNLLMWDVTHQVFASDFLLLFVNEICKYYGSGVMVAVGLCLTYAVQACVGGKAE